MKKLIICLTAGLLVIGAQSLYAQSSTNSVDSTPSTPGAHKGQNHDHAAILKLIGLDRADLKDLSPEERHTKIKETADKVVADLKAKQTAGTITPEEKTKLEKIQKFLANAGHHKPGTTPPAGTGSSTSNN